MGNCCSSDTSDVDQKRPLIQDETPVFSSHIESRSPQTTPIKFDSKPAKPSRANVTSPPLHIRQTLNDLEPKSGPSLVSLKNDTYPDLMVSSEQGGTVTSVASANFENFSPETQFKSLSCKLYFYDYYFNLLSYLQARRVRSQNFKALLLSKDMTPEERENEWLRHFAKERMILRKRRQRLTLVDFHLIIKVGEGAYGEVFLCKKKDTGELCAVKRVDKKLLFLKENIDQIKTERQVMSTASSPWLVKLLYAFQDKDYAYLAMEFVPGGDLRTLIRHSGVLYEDNARFFAAEIVMGLEALHSMGYSHRDLKPDNILISATGHLVLSDFGLSKGGPSKEMTQLLSERLHQVSGISVSKSKESTVVRRKKHLKNMMNKKKAFSLVGSPDYMAPEIMRGSGYDFRVDFWSLGCIIFEFLCGFPPFSADTVNDVWANVLNWQVTLERPVYEGDDEEFNLSDTAWDLISKLICERDDRLGIQEIKQHPFFSGIDWTTLRQMRPPFVPQLSDECDTSYFDDFNDEEIQNQYNMLKKHKNSDMSETDQYLLEIDVPRAAFVGFTYKHSDYLIGANHLTVNDKSKVDPGNTLF